MRGDRLKEIIGELRDLVEQAQASLDDRPVLQRLLTALKEKIAEAADEDGSRTRARRPMTRRRNRASLTVPLYPILASRPVTAGRLFLREPGHIRAAVAAGAICGPGGPA